MPETQLIDIISSGGAFALATFLVVYVMRESSRREVRSNDLLEKYAMRIEDMCTQLKLMNQRLDTIEDRLPVAPPKQ